jgi:hypothetical protein
MYVVTELRSVIRPERLLPTQKGWLGNLLQHHLSKLIACHGLPDSGTITIVADCGSIWLPLSFSTVI